MTLASLPPELAEAFERRFGARLRAGAATTSSSAWPRSTSSEMIRAALDAGAEVRSLAPHRVSLETIFLSAVEQGAREERLRRRRRAA